VLPQHTYPTPTPTSMPRTQRLLSLPVALLAVLPLLLAGCSGGKLSPEKARAAVVVEAGGAKLTGATLAGWLAQAPTPPTMISAALLVGTWLDATLLDQALRKGPPLDDSATVDLAIAPDAARGMMLDFWQKRAKARPPITNAQADSLADLDRVRVFQQLFVALPASLDSAAAAPVIARVRSLATRAREPGADFTALIREVSTDSATLAQKGFLPAMTRADLPEAISGAIWALRPGEVSGILGSSGGAHLFRRATRAEAQAGLKQWLAPQLALRAEQRFIDSLTNALGVTFSADAVVRVRAMAPEPVPAAEGGALVTWKGGELSATKVRSWLTMLGPNERAMLGTSSDSSAIRFLRELAQREIILGLVSPAPPPNAEARAVLAPQYRQSLDTAKARLKEVTAGRPEGEAGTAYLEAILIQRIFYRPLPGNLAGILRLRYSATVNSPALEGIVSASNTEWREKHANDSSQTGTPKPPTGQAPLPLPGGTVPPAAPPKP